MAERSFPSPGLTAGLCWSLDDAALPTPHCPGVIPHSPCFLCYVSTEQCEQKALKSKLLKETFVLHL